MTKRSSHKSFKIAIFTLLILSVTIPSLFLSGILIKIFYEQGMQSVHTNVALRTSNLANQIEHEIGLVNARLQTLAMNTDMQLSTINTLFAYRAYSLMESFSQQNYFVDTMYIFGDTGRTMEVMPAVAEFVDNPIPQAVVNQYLAQVRASKSYEPHIFMIKDEKFDKTIREYLVGRKALDSDSFIVVMMPLIVDQLRGAGKKEVKGVLAALIPVSYVFKTMKASLSKSEKVDIIWQGKSLLHDPLTQPDRYIKETRQISIQGKPLFDLVFADEYINQFKKERSELIILFFIVAIGFSLFLGGMFLWLRHLTKPLDSVVSVLQQFSDGRYEVDVGKFEYREFHRIMEVLTLMSSRVLDEQYKLESRVLERTKALERSNKELQYTMDVLQQAQAHLVETEKMSLLGQLVAGVAHEINTPVGISVTAASLAVDHATKLKEKMADGTLTKSEHARLVGDIIQSNEMILNNLMRASELINNFKTVAVEQSSLQLRNFNLHDFMTEVVSSLNHKLKKQHVTLEIEGDKTLKINSYPGVFGQIITNFVLNSLLHAFENQVHPKISIHYHMVDRTMYLEYKDNGAGMSHEVTHKVFEPFFTTKRGSGGSGLGMHVVYNLVTQTFHGKVKCESELNQGVKFTIWFEVPDTIEEFN